MLIKAKKVAKKSTRNSFPNNIIIFEEKRINGTTKIKEKRKFNFKLFFTIVSNSILLLLEIALLKIGNVTSVTYPGIINTRFLICKMALTNPFSAIPPFLINIDCAAQNAGASIKELNKIGNEKFKTSFDWKISLFKYTNEIFNFLRLRYRLIDVNTVIIKQKIKYPNIAPYTS